MSTTTSTAPSALAAAPEGVTPQERFIQRQLDRTRRHVKLVDLSSALMLLAAGILGFLLVVAVVDHWLIGLGTVGRYAVWLTLLAAVTVYFAVVLVPLLFLTINPVYAARVIEQSDPSLKNSLVNFLLFRFDRAGVRTAVYQALQQRAAADLAHVEVETAVDRSPLIRVGYLLAAVLTVFAGYTILCPKSPFQSAARVITPWADLARPSRVRITDVRPGSRRVFHGEEVAVSAAVFDLREGEPVTLLYSSLDGRLTRQSVPLSAAADGLMYHGRLSPNGEGVQQDLLYWIEAGDAATPAYHLSVVPAPTILVEQVTYQYPQYTRQPPQTIEKQGDIRGLEGTRVTVRARANLPIQSAVLEFDPVEATGVAETPGNGNGRSGGAPRMLDMAVQDRTASCSFVLEMDSSATRGWHAWYHIRFVTDEGQRNPQPILHRLDVSRDLAPEIEILTPSRPRLELPLDGSQPIEVRAIDPDFGLVTIRLRAVAGGTAILDQPLLNEPAGVTGQQIVKTALEPARLRLSPGDRVELWAVAEDNRRPSDGAPPDPNVVKTGTYQILILPPEKSVLKPGAKPAEKPEAKADEPKAKTDAGNTSEQRPTDPPAPKSGTEKGADQPQPGQTGSDQEKGKDGLDSGSPGGSGTGSQDAKSAPGSQKPDGGQSPGQSAGQEDSKGGDQGAAQSSKSDSGGMSPSPSEGGQSQPSSGDPSGAGGQPSGSGGQAGAGQPGTSSGGQSGSGQPQPAGAENAADAGQPGDSGEPLHDGQVIEKTLQHMQQQAGKAPAGSGGQTAKTGPDASAAKDGQGASQANRPDEASQSPRPKRDGDQAGQPPDGKGQPGKQNPDGSPSPDSPQQSPKGPSSGDGGQQQPDKNQGAGDQQKQGPGTGSQPKGPAETGAGTKPKSAASDGEKQPGEGDSGKSGKGQNSDSQSGSAGSMDQNRGQPKQSNAAGGTPKPNTEPQAPSLSKKQSAGGGDEGGDKSGGAKQGGGQGANQPGNDSPGSNSAADEGAGAATEPGAGDTAKGPGNKEQSPMPTGAAGDQPGLGSGTRPAENEPSAGGPDADNNTGGGGARPPTAPNKQAQQAEKGTKGRPMGGGVPGEADFDNQVATQGEVPPGDEPNLQHARRATDMVLEYLRNQQRKPDPDLLNKLGWTAEDLQQFLRRWDELKRSAREDAAARRELEEALRSLGLRPAGDKARGVNARNDQARGMRETGAHSSPPPSYLEQFNAYKKGTSRTIREQNGERGAAVP